MKSCLPCAKFTGIMQVIMDVRTSKTMGPPTADPDGSLDRLASLGRANPISRTTLSEQIATIIATMISEGKWKPSEKLPSEPALCQSFGVGRSTLREALKALSFVGMVEIQHGGGTYVSAEATSVLRRILPQAWLAEEKVSDLCEARIALESELVALCARRATEEDLENIEKLVNEMRQAFRESGDRFLQLDLEFHLTIANASKNQVLADSLRTIRELLHELIKKSQELPGGREVALAHHTKILEALKQRNPRKARTAMRSHVGLFQRRYKMLLKTIRSTDAAASTRKGDSTVQGALGGVSLPS